MNGFERWLAVNGIVRPTGAVLIEAAVALGLALACLAAGYAVDRLLGPRTAQFWTRRIGGHVEGLGPRTGVIIRSLTAFVLVSIVFRSPHARDTPASIVFGPVLGGTAGQDGRASGRGRGWRYG